MHHEILRTLINSELRDHEEGWLATSIARSQPRRSDQFEHYEFTKKTGASTNIIRSIKGWSAQHCEITKKVVISSRITRSREGWIGPSINYKFTRRSDQSGISSSRRRIKVEISNKCYELSKRRKLGSVRVLRDHK